MRAASGPWHTESSREHLGLYLVLQPAALCLSCYGLCEVLPEGHAFWIRRLVPLVACCRSFAVLM